LHSRAPPDRTGALSPKHFDARVQRSRYRRHGASETEMQRAAAVGGVRFLLEDALDKVRQGLTTIEEVLRVIRIDPADDQRLAWLATPAGRAMRLESTSA
jgi:hypothetical protein